jgi:hypothetical protein
MNSTKGSYAAQYQRDHYGGYIPEYSTFSHFQSAATVSDDDTTGNKLPIYARVLGWVAGFLAVRALFL